MISDANIAFLSTRLSLPFCNNNFTQKCSTRFTTWNYGTRQAHGEKLLRVSAVDGKGLVVWCVTPNMTESEVGKVTSPTESSRNPTDKG